MESGQTDGIGDSSDVKWSFGGALLYSVTLLTTVGYGRLSPRTSTGKAVAMVYAAIGVPLMLILLSGFGTFLAAGAKRAYSKICCLPNIEKRTGGYERAPSSPGKHICRNNQHEDSTPIQLASTYSTSSNHHNHYNHLHNQPSQHSSPVNHRLVDHEDVESAPQKKALLATVRASHARGRCRQGLAHQMMADQLAQQRSSDIEDAEDVEDLENEGQTIHNTPSRIPLIWHGSSEGGMSKRQHSTSTQQTATEQSPTYTPHQPVVPTSVILLFLAGYVCLGAGAFASSADWSFLDAAYFCFIALSTIGIIPNNQSSAELSFGSQLQLVACCVYLVLGLVLVAMCFTLLQEEISYKCRQFAESIGLVRH